MRKLCNIAYLFFAPALLLHGQNACNKSWTVTSLTASTNFDNRTLKCNTWSMVAQNNNGFSALTLDLEAAPDNNGTPGTFFSVVALAPTTNPCTSINACLVIVQAPWPWWRVKALALTGTGSITVLLNGANGTSAKVPQSGAVLAAALNLFSQTQQVTVTGTVAETTLTGTGVGSLTLPPNYFSSSGDTLHVSWEGFDNPHTAAGASLIFRPKLGSAVLNADLTPTTTSAVTGNFGCRLDVNYTALSVGGSGTVIGNGRALCVSDGNFDWFPLTLVSAVTVDTTSALTFDLTIQLGNASQSITTTNLLLSRI